MLGIATYQPGFQPSCPSDRSWHRTPILADCLVLFSMKGGASRSRKRHLGSACGRPGAPRVPRRKARIAAGQRSQAPIGA